MKQHIVIALSAATLMALAGCASSTPNYDARFGDAVRQARAAMALNAQPAPVQPTTTEGRIVREANDRYVDSFKAPPPVVNVINIGGAVGGGGAGR